MEMEEEWNADNPEDLDFNSDSSNESDNESDDDQIHHVDGQEVENLIIHGVQFQNINHQNIQRAVAFGLFKETLIRDNNNVMKLEDILNTTFDDQLNIRLINELNFNPDHSYIYDQNNVTNNENHNMNKLSYLYKYFKRRYYELFDREKLYEMEELVNIFHNTRLIVKISDKIDLYCKNIKHRVDIISFASNLLITLPVTLFQFTNVRELKLENNLLIAIPEEICHMKQLTSLDLSFNRLTKLPDSMGKLSKLSVLIIGNNDITYFPDSFRNLKELLYIHASFNKISYIPEFFIDLNLEHLDLGYNNITKLPIYLFQLPITCRLYLRNNKINEQLVSENKSKRIISGFPEDEVVSTNNINSFTPNFLSVYKRKKFLTNYFMLDLKCDTPIVESLLFNYKHKFHDCRENTLNHYNVWFYTKRGLLLPSEMDGSNNNMNVRRIINSMEDEHKNEFYIILFLINVFVCCISPRLMFFPMLYLIATESFLSLLYFVRIYKYNNDKSITEYISEYVYSIKFDGELFELRDSKLMNIFVIISRYLNMRITHLHYMIIEFGMVKLMLNIIEFLFNFDIYIIKFASEIILLEISMNFVKLILILINQHYSLKIDMKKDCEFCLYHTKKKRNTIIKNGMRYFGLQFFILLTSLFIIKMLLLIYHSIDITIDVNVTIN